MTHYSALGTPRKRSNQGTVKWSRSDSDIISVILRSIQLERFGERPAKWIFQELQRRDGVEASPFPSAAKKRYFEAMVGFTQPFFITPCDGRKLR